MNMVKGFNEEYISQQLEYYEKLAAADETYEDELFTYQLLYATLIFQDGVVTHHEVSTEEFLDGYNDTNNLFPLKNRLLKGVVRKITDKVRTLDHLETQEFKEVIDKEDSFLLVGEFIKDTFGKEYYDIYHRLILHNRDYILFDKHNMADITTTLTGEYFIKLPSTSDIEFTSDLAHETGHLIKRVIYGNPVRVSFLSELESFSFELGMLLWMIKQNVYSEDAKIRITNMMALIESLTIARYYDNLYSLHTIKYSDVFNEYVEKENILAKVNVSKYDDLFNLLANTIETNFVSYLLSFLSSIEILSSKDFCAKYQYILQNLETMSDSRFLKMLGLNSLTNLDTYQELRKRVRK